MGLTVADFSRVVARIHSAPERPEAWQAALVELASCMEATSCSLAIAADEATGIDSGHTILATTITPEAATAYQSYYHDLDFVLGECERSPIGMVCSGFDLVSSHRHTEFHNDWQRPFDMVDGLHVRLAGPTPTSFLVSAPPRSQPYANTERIRFLDALVPHLQHALSARHQLLNTTHTPSDLTALDLAAVTQVTGHGVVVIGTTGQILATNPAARRIVDGGDGLRVRDLRLQISAASADDDLQVLLAAALGGFRHTTVRFGGHVVCPRPSGARHYLLRVVPLDTEHDPCAGRAAIIIVDPTRQPKPPRELLRAMFGLTATEADIALRLLDGTGIPAIAEDLALSAATIKTHAHNVFAKTDTHRQAELVRLLATLTN